MELSDIYLHIGRSWLLERNPRDDSRDDIIATELSSGQRYSKEGHLPRPLGPALESVFCRVWPKREVDTGDWQDDWYSWPLSDY